MRAWRILAAYVMIWLLSYGWIANEPCPQNHRYSSLAECDSRSDAAFLSIYIALAWPFYWTYQAFKLVRKP